MSNSSSVWNPDNVRDVAESIGLNALPPEVVDHLTRDVEFRIAQVIEEALKFMRHSKRTTLHTQDVTQALRALDVEPLYGYESMRPLRFGEASIGPGQPLFYLEDEEIDFERLINQPLPKVPREMCFTAHWLAVEGVQPTIPQNPTPADTARQQEQSGLSLLPKTGTGGNNSVLAATAGADNLSVKPLVKHVLSKELQLYFEHVTGALMDETSTGSGDDAYRLAALNSLSVDPGLHQLVPYFVQFVAEKVTHNLKSIFVLTQVLHLVSALLSNANLHITPYVSALIPPVLTCLVGKRLGHTSAPEHLTNGNTLPPPLPQHYPLRRLASSVLQSLTRPAFVAATPTLKPRLARTLLKHLLSTTPQPLGVQYGALLGLSHIAGVEGIRTLVLPNLKHALSAPLKDALAEEKTEKGAAQAREAQEVIAAVLTALKVMADDAPVPTLAVAATDDDEMEMDSDDAQIRGLVDRLGDPLAAKVASLGDLAVIRAVLAEDITMFAGAG